MGGISTSSAATSREIRTWRAMSFPLNQRAIAWLEIASETRAANHPRPSPKPSALLPAPFGKCFGRAVSCGSTSADTQGQQSTSVHRWKHNNETREEGDGKSTWKTHRLIDKLHGLRAPNHDHCQSLHESLPVVPTSKLSRPEQAPHFRSLV